MDVIYPVRLFHGKGVAGFTLIELLIALVIVSILLGMAAPSFSELIQSNRLTGHINHMVSHLNYARSESIKNNRNIIICKSSDGTNCNNSSQWEEGWIVFIDNDENRQHQSDEPLLAIQDALNHGINISYGGFPSDNYILYYPNGRSLGNGTFTFCDSRGKNSAKALVLYKTGRLRTARSMPGGSELVCPAT